MKRAINLLFLTSPSGRFRLAHLVFLSFFLLPQDAAAFRDGFSAGWAGGTRGSELVLGYRFSDYLGIRAVQGLGYAYKVSEYDFNSDDDNSTIYSGELELDGSGIFVDFFPFESRFYLSAGQYKSDFKATLNSGAGNFSVGDNFYPVDDIRTIITPNKDATYYGLGWGSKPRGESGIALTLDMGVLQFAKPDVALDILSPEEALIRSSGDYQRELDEISQDASDFFSNYSVLQIGLSYSF